MLKIRPYRIGDIDHIMRREKDDFGSESFETTRLMCEEHLTFTFEHDGIPVSIVGIYKLWTGVAHIWSVVSDDVRGQGLNLTRTVKHMLDDYAKAYNLWRLQAAVKADIAENNRWMKVLGFKFESTAKYGSPDKQDLNTYVRIYHEQLKISVNAET